MRIANTVAVLALALMPMTMLDHASAAPKAELPEARQVVVRRSKDLRTAIAAAFGSRAETAAGVAAVVIDVTPHTRKSAAQISTALHALDGKPGLPSEWQVAALGRRFRAGPASAAEAASRIQELVSQDLPVPDTDKALRTTIKSFKGRGGTLIYLADWRFEDEHDLESLIRLLASKQLAFGVVGSEAAFGRGWNDGILDMRDQLENGQLVLKDASKQKRYDETIGRRPFGPFDPKAPWHGGDTAYPHVPYRFSEKLWETVFDPSILSFGKSTDGLPNLKDLQGGNMEDLLERLGRSKKVFGSASSRRAALPSAYGPHGLMRAAGVRGGRYVLWSWNPEHRASLTYDYARCDQFGPDLRRRSTIRKDASRRPLARALLKAWDTIGSKYNALAEHTAPLDKSGTRPQSIDLLERSATTLPTMWMDKTQHKEFLRKAKHWQAAAAAVDKLLGKALAGARSEPDAADRRYAADAALLRHIARVLHFELSEALAAAATVPDDAWKQEDTYPGIRPTTWIQRGDDPENIQTTDAHVFGTERGARLKDARSEHLRRFGGTPFGVQVAANTVETWVLTTGKKIKSTPGQLQPPGRTPSESQGNPPIPTPRPPGGGSGGAGPSSGG
ncbi:MAG: hypothetical protein GY946_15135 [bacterium]|nr:hypothetical protein [bacterium]